MMSQLLDLFFRRKLARRTDGILTETMLAPERVSREQASTLLRELSATSEPSVTLGRTTWGQDVSVPLSRFMNASGIATGGMGVGKTQSTLLPGKAIIGQLPQNRSIGSFGTLDPKKEYFVNTIGLLGQRLEELYRQDPKLAEELRRSVIILDFSSRDQISPYNILKRWKNAEPDFFAASRADLLLDLLDSGDGLSITASALLQKAIRLLSEFDLPITWLDELLYDESFRSRLVNRTESTETAIFFTRNFPSVPKQTVAALSRRIGSLFSSEGVRQALSATTSPDLAAAQDEGKIVLVNFFGSNISRGVRQLLQALVFSDVTQAVFARRNHNRPFLWFCDEAQTLFATPRLRDNMSDLLTMSRSFGSHLVLITQNLSAAVQDTRLLRLVDTNIKWSFSMRGEPDDCAFLRPVLPVTGRKLQPKANPFDPPRFYSLNDERNMELSSIAHLPDRTGYLWLRDQSGDAIKIRTKDLDLPSGAHLAALVDPLLSDPSFGMRVSREEHVRNIEERRQAWFPEAVATMDTSFAEAYRHLRGESS